MKAVGQFALLKQGRFAPFFVTQLFGAFNDHFFKNSLSALITFGMVGLTAGEISRYNTMLSLIFVAPGVLIIPLAGQLADRFEKALLLRWTKLFEIGVTLLGAIGFLQHSMPLLLTALALMGMHGSFFALVKLSIIPQLTCEEELIGGNALVEGSAPVMILLGSILGTSIGGNVHGAARAGLITVAIAVVGYLASRLIKPVQVTAPSLRIDWNPLTEAWHSLRYLSRDRTMLLAAIGVSWYWFYGVVLTTQIPNLARIVLGAGPQVVALLLLAFSVGTAIGALLCDRLSRHRVEIGLAPLGALGMALLGGDLYFAAPATGAVMASAEQLQRVGEFLGTFGGIRLVLDLMLFGLFGGLYLVPQYALLQSRTEASHRARVIGGTNLLSQLFSLASASACIGLLHAGLTVPQVLLAAAVAHAAITLLIYVLAPEFLTRFVAWARGFPRQPESA